jgi:hypothetical protein
MAGHKLTSRFCTPATELDEATGRVRTGGDDLGRDEGVRS